jgi:hypothetical protein
MDVVASGADLSNDPKFTEAAARKVYYGPVYFRRESEPYMTQAIAGTRRDAGVSVAEVNLRSGTWSRRSRSASAAASLRQQ